MHALFARLHIMEFQRPQARGAEEPWRSWRVMLLHANNHFTRGAPARIAVQLEITEEDRGRRARPRLSERHRDQLGSSGGDRGAHVWTHGRPFFTPSGIRARTGAQLWRR